ncbi:hypothetical protein Tco_1154188 [Tanacetum coccineum]
MYNTCCSSKCNIWYQRVPCIILVVFLEHKSVTLLVFEVTMKILPVSSSNSTVVGWSSQNQRYKRRCCSPIPAKLDSLPCAHTHALKVNHSTSRLLRLNKNVISQKAQVHVKFSNSNNHKLPHHQTSSNSNKELSSKEIVRGVYKLS